MIIMPIYNSSSSKFQYTMALDGNTYQFTFQFNFREGFWYMDIGDVDGNYIRTGFKLTVGYYLLNQYRGDNLPPGNFIVLNLANDAVTILNFDTLGQQYKLVYLTEAEMASGVVTGG